MGQDRGCPARSHRPWAEASGARAGFVLVSPQVGQRQTLFWFVGARQPAWPWEPASEGEVALHSGECDPRRGCDLRGRSPPCRHHLEMGIKGALRYWGGFSSLTLKNISIVCP